jgi:hypothetical protein
MLPTGRPRRISSHHVEVGPESSHIIGISPGSLPCDLWTPEPARWTFFGAVPIRIAGASECGHTNGIFNWATVEMGSERATHWPVWRAACYDSSYAAPPYLLSCQDNDATDEQRRKERHLACGSRRVS